jgi:hypothetical protein
MIRRRRLLWIIPPIKLSKLRFNFFVEFLYARFICAEGLPPKKSSEATPQTIPLP